MKHWIRGIAWVLVGGLAGCGGQEAGTRGIPTSAGSLVTAGGAALTTSGGGGQDPSDPGGGDPDNGTTTADDPFGDEPNFDVAEPPFCKSEDAGIFCDEPPLVHSVHAVHCDGAGNEVGRTLCTSGICIPGEGCVPCVEGEWTCKGPRVMACNTQGAAYWEEIAVCDPAALQYCDVSVQGCSALHPIGNVEPTGEYYAYSTFRPIEDGFDSISDVDSHDNRIWFVGYEAGAMVVGAYDVTLLDSDADGVLEPHQHPDSPDDPGDIEQRVFTFVDAFPIENDGAYPHQMELHATETTLTFGGPLQITELVIDSGIRTQVAPVAPWIQAMIYPGLSFLGYDDVHDVWYSGNESARRVFQYDSETETWGYAFEYPALAGDHMDGLDVVIDPDSRIPYLYVSDMTSNFIGQYRHDPKDGWVQENLFSYADDVGASVEGFGFGALNHFWVGGYEQNSFYEIGGGALTKFLEPEG